MHLTQRCPAPPKRLFTTTTTSTTMATFPDDYLFNTNANINLSVLYLNSVAGTP